MDLKCNISNGFSNLVLVSAFDFNGKIRQSQNDNIFLNITLKETLVRFEREINSLKGEYTQEIEYLNTAVARLVRENKQLTNSNQKYCERFQNVQNQISSLRDNNENLSSTATSLSAALNITEKQCSSNKTCIEKLTNQNTEFRKTLIEYEKNTETLNADVNKIKNNFKHLFGSVSELRTKLKSETIRIDKLSDTRPQGVMSLKTKTNLINDKLKEFDDMLNKVDSDLSSHSKSISDLRKRMVNTEKDVKTLYKSSKSYADILKSKCDKITDTVHSLSETEPNDNSVSETVKNPVITNPASAKANVNVQHSVDQSLIHILSTSTNHEQHSVKIGEQQNNSEIGSKNTAKSDDNVDSVTTIPVHFPTSVCNPCSADNFRGFTSKQKTTVRRFYVGGIDKYSSSEESMRSYLYERGVRVTYLRYFDRPNRRAASAQLNIDARSEHLIHDSFFLADRYFSKRMATMECVRSNKDRINQNDIKYILLELSRCNVRCAILA